MCHISFCFRSDHHYSCNGDRDMYVCMCVSYCMMDGCMVVLYTSRERDMNICLAVRVLNINL